MKNVSKIPPVQKGRIRTLKLKKASIVKTDQIFGSEILYTIEVTVQNGLLKQWLVNPDKTTDKNNLDNFLKLKPHFSTFSLKNKKI